MASSLDLSSADTDEALQEIAYRDSFNDKSKKVAFLYRKDEIQKPIDLEFQLLVRKFIANKETFIKRIIDYFKSSGMKDDEDTIKKCIEEETKIFNDIGLCIDDSLKLLIPKMVSVIKTQGIGNEKELIKSLDEAITEGQEKISDDLMPLARAKAFEKYFERSYKDIDEGGMVYALPNGKHKWTYNASWLRGHFNKGTDTFVIKTPIDEASMYRGESSDHQGDIGSGFFREIATCCMFGYNLKIESGQIVLHHDNPAKLAGVTLQDITKVPIEAMVPFYKKAMEDYEVFKKQLDFAARISGIESAENKHRDEDAQEDINTILLQMHSHATKQSAVTRGPITSWVIQTKDMNEQEAVLKIKELIKAGIDKSLIKITSLEGIAGSSSIKIQCSTPEEIQCIHKILRTQISSITEINHSGPPIIKQFATSKSASSKAAKKDEGKDRDSDKNMTTQKL